MPPKKHDVKDILLNILRFILIGSKKKKVELPPHLRKSWIREYFESAVITVIMALFGMTFVVQAVKVPTGSMLNTILIGDHLLVNKFIFGMDGLGLSQILPQRPIRRGDIIVFKYPKDPNTNYVKRVIGLPGETIEIKGHKVFINGNELPENRFAAEVHLGAQSLPDTNAPLDVTSVETTPQATYNVYYSSQTLSSEEDEEEPLLSGQLYGVKEPFKIPQGHYFVMGDNRENSQDSRYWGSVPRENVVGRALFVYWSLDTSRDENGNNSSGNFIVDFITRTRWKRMGTLIR
ncbi:MAG: signal peptidase I [Acidobacteriota bacterium]|nr:signal peptidase I [Blastocatellia bacterium]MDW8412054.1 signal peptidase I [Acidobacteriota bacterium]